MNELKTLNDKPSQTKGVNRRRFVRGVGIAIPVALTVSARSALANTCSAVSANASIALTNSHQATGDTGLTCSGWSPVTWAGKIPDDYKPNNRKFNIVFGSGPDVTMRQVIKNGDDDFEKYIAAAYMNFVKNKLAVTSGGETVYDLADLKAMWDGRTGTYKPVPGVSWGSEQIKLYLATTWD
jgi:hypothetical protein